MLRYGTDNPTIESKPILNIKVIAQTLKLSSYYVTKLLGLASAEASTDILRGPGRTQKLKRKHLVYITNPNTLNRWAGFSLAERVKMFHRRFPDIRISKTLL